MIGNSWVTTLKRPSQNQGLEHIPVLINASFSMVLHLNWCESIIQSFSKAHTVAATTTIRAFAVLTLAEKARVVQGKNFKDAGEFCFVLA